MVATPLIPALGRQRLVDLCTDSLVCGDSSRTTRTMEKPPLKKQNYNPPRVEQNWTKVKAGTEDESITGKSACPGRCLAARGQSLIISHGQLRH